MDAATRTSLEEAFRIVASDKPPASEKYDPKAILDLALRWDYAHRFPREYAVLQF